MAKPLMDVFGPTNLRVSLPEEFEEAFHSLPGVGILSADQRGDKTESAWGTPSLQVTFPRRVNHAKIDETFKDSGILLHHGRNVIGRNTVMFHQHGPGEWEDDSKWWRAILTRLRELALPDFAPIGPFDVHYLWVTDPTYLYPDNFGLKIVDTKSHIGVTLAFDVVGGEFASLLFQCDNLRGDRAGIEYEIRQSLKDHPETSWEKYHGMGFDQVVDMVMQLSESFDGFPWSLEEVRTALMKAFHRCVQFAG